MLAACLLYILPGLLSLGIAPHAGAQAGETAPPPVTRAPGVVNPLAPAPPTAARPGAVQPVAARPAIDVQVTVFSYGPGFPDDVAVAYSGTPSDDQIRQDMSRVAVALGIAAPALTVTRSEGIPAVEAKLFGLTNWGTGAVNLDPLIHAYRRFGRFRVLCLFAGRFPLRSTETIVKPPLRVETRASGGSVSYDIWIDQAAVAPARLTTAPEAPPAGPAWIIWLAAGAIVLIVVGAVLLVAYIYMNQRRAVTAREGKL